MAYAGSAAYDNWRRQQEQERIQNEYNAQKTALDQKYSSGGLSGFLGSIVGGIGKMVGDTAKGIGGLFGTAGASFKDIVEGKASTAENTNAFKRYWYGADSDKDAVAKAAGTSLNAATNLATLALPAAGAGTTAAKVATSAVGNTAAGALGGIADEFQEQGANADMSNAANRAIAGGAAGLVAGGLNKKIGNATSKVGSALLNNKVATSTIGRGALSGAVGGSIGAGTSAALSGGDVAQAVLQGGLTGAVGGAAQAGIMNTVGKAGSKLKNSAWERQQDNNFIKTVNNPNSAKEDVYLGALNEKNFSDVKNLYDSMGLTGDDMNAITVRDNKMYLTKTGAQHLNERRIVGNGITAESLKDTMRNSTKNGVVVPELTRYGNATMGAARNDGKYDISHLGVEDGHLSLVSTYPERTGSISKKIDSALGGVHSPSTNLVDQTGLPVGPDSALQSGATSSSVSQNSRNVNSNLMYGESQLANRTRRGQTAEALSRLGNTLEGAQANVTRAAARDLGIESTGKVIENVRKKTGITNLETQAALAKELTGGENSLMDRIQKQALSATEDGKPFKIDTSDIISSVNKIVDKYADANTFGSESAKTKFANNLKNDIANGGSDIITKANRMKSSAADLRGKGITNPSAKDAAAAKIYTEVANKLDDLSYSAIPQENVDAMFDATISEMRGRAQQAQTNGNKDIANAYNNLANSLDAEPRTIKAFRSFKKDFVDTSKISQLTGQAENGAAFQMGSSFSGGIKRGINTMLQRPVNAALAKTGGVINSIADRFENGTQPTTSASGSTYQPLNQNFQNIIGNYIGRTTGQIQAGGNIQNIRKATDYENLENMLSGMQLISQGNVYNGTPSQSSAIVNGGYGQNNQVVSQLNDISNAMNLALAAGDIQAYSQLASLYQTAYNIYESQNQTQESQLTTSEKNQLAKLESAGTALDELEALYEKAGGGQGIIGGNIANFLGGLGLNSDVSTYNQLAQGLINQIGAAIGKTDSLNTEGEVQRALSLVPKITDDQQTAMNKLATLRSLLQTNTGIYNQQYSM